ncbi:hypothetical protein ACC699_37935, partial [Rhizobium ruizarguesonis]
MRLDGDLPAFRRFRGVGEDGTTHQPVEQLAGLRAIPNLMV